MPGQSSWVVIEVIWLFTLAEVAFEGELLPPELACGNTGTFGIFPGTADL